MRATTPTTQAASSFPFHAQRRSMSCALACARMVEEYLAGAARSEKAWEGAVDEEWDADDGILSSKLFRHLRTLAGGHGARSRVLLRFGQPTGRAPLVAPGAMVVLLIDSATYNGTALARNVGHYVVAHTFVDIARPMDKRPLAKRRRCAAVYHDPQIGPDQVWSWRSLWLTAHAAMLIEPAEDRAWRTKRA